jgi:hypothetical protein
VYEAIAPEIALAYRFFEMRRAGRLTAKDAAGAKVEIPDALARIFGDRMLVTAATRSRTWRDVASLFHDRPLLLGFCDRIAACDPTFAHTMIARLIPEAPHDRGAISGLPGDVHAALEQALTAVPRRSVWNKVVDTVGDAASIGAADNWIVRASGGGGPGPPREYTHHARPAIAGVLADVGVPVPVALAWITSHRRVVKSLARYDRIFQGDLALQLCGMIGTIMHMAARPVPGAADGTSPYRGEVRPG